MRYKKSAVIPLLDLGQRQNGNFCTVAVMDKVAQILEMPNIDVYEVATFYTMFNRLTIYIYKILNTATIPHAISKHFPSVRTCVIPSYSSLNPRVVEPKLASTLFSCVARHLAWSVAAKK